MAEEPEARIERRGRAGFIVLDRPRALNALTLTMVRAISRALDDFERDPAIARVVVAAGGRAFCAGGDIRKLYEQGRAGDHAAQLTFWREEYILDQRIKRFSKPYVALIDGIVMGGGVGLGMHGSHRVVSERCVFAMPEVGIGFFPDVGATWLLPRLPHRIGVFLALTGLSAEAGDLAALGLVTAFAPSGSFQALERALEGESSLEEILLRFARAGAALAADGRGPGDRVRFRAVRLSGYPRLARGPGREGVAIRRERARRFEAEVADEPGHRVAPDDARRRSDFRGCDGTRISDRFAHLSRTRLLRGRSSDDHR